MKAEIIAKLEKVNDEKVLVTILNLLEKRPGLSIRDMYNDAVQEYGDTLKRLAQE